MFNRFSLGATILGIFLLAIFGIGRAFSWLTESPGNDDFADRGVPVESRDSDSFISNQNGDRQLISQADNETISQSNGQSNGQSSGQSNGQSNGSLSEDVLAPTPLETAGTYIQRQKGAELDQLIADSNVDATPLATDGAVPAQDDTPITQPEPVTSTDTGSTAPASQSVPALW
ncbi:MAG: hypothetical protein WA949_03075 [Phormidesmis sp.]